MKKYSSLAIIFASVTAIGISQAVAGATNAAPAAAGTEKSSRAALPSKIADKRLILDVACARDHSTARGRQEAACTVDRLVAVGAFGHILLSDDRGKTWQQANHVPVNSTLTAVHFPSKNIGYAVGQDNVILKTINGGETWVRIHIDPDALGSPGRVKAFSDEPSNCGGAQEQDNCLIPLFAVHFRDDDHGIVLGAFGQALSTEDGGKTWTWRPFPPALVKNEFEDPDDPNDDYEPFEAHLNGITQTSNGNIYVAAEYGTVYRSTDGGKVFRAITTGYNGSFWGVLELGSSVLAYGMRGNIWRSDNHGQTWRKLETTNYKTGKATRQSFQSAIRLASSDVVLAGLNGVIAISRDGGRSFTAITREERKGYAALAEGANDNILLFGENGIKRIRLNSLPR